LISLLIGASAAREMQVANPQGSSLVQREDWGEWLLWQPIGAILLIAVILGLGKAATTFDLRKKTIKGKVVYAVSCLLAILEVVYFVWFTFNAFQVAAEDSHRQYLLWQPILFIAVILGLGKAATMFDLGEKTIMVVYAVSCLLVILEVVCFAWFTKHACQIAFLIFCFLWFLGMRCTSDEE